MKIEIKKHGLTGEDLVEISDGKGLIATIIPRANEISIVSRFIVDVTKDMAYPSKITINLIQREIT